MAERKPRNILFGVCGIGSGHTYRQLPTIEYFLGLGDRLVIFAYGESLAFYQGRYGSQAGVMVVSVSVPFYVGNKDGLDFEATAALEKNRKVDHTAVNTLALAAAQRFFCGKADLVVSDYEPVAAQFAYATGSPLVTIDQQSKYLVGDFPEDLGGLFYRDEIARLKLFFPRADKRIACSFFQVAGREKPEVPEGVTLCPAIMKDSIIKLKRIEQRQGSACTVLVYISAQQDFVQKLADVVDICAGQPQSDFHVFLPRGADDKFLARANVTIYRQGDERFLDLLSRASAIITTGGHTLLSEAMHLGIPAYVVPLPVYEQAMNAHVIDKHGFGLARSGIYGVDLAHFLANLPAYARAIAEDRQVLLRGQGRDTVIALLEELLG